MQENQIINTQQKSIEQFVFSDVFGDSIRKLSKQKSSSGQEFEKAVYCLNIRYREISPRQTKDGILPMSESFIVQKLEIFFAQAEVVYKMGPYADLTAKLMNTVDCFKKNIEFDPKGVAGSKFKNLHLKPIVKFNTQWELRGGRDPDILCCRCEK